MKKLYAPLLLLLALFVSFSAYSLPKLNSFPSATATVYLDFDGEDVTSAYWNAGKAFTCAAAGFTDAQVTEVFNRVSEDYRPFNINITTDLSKFIAAPLSSRIRVIVTPTSSWFTGVGGVSFTGSFKWGDDTPSFVFCDRLGPNNAKMVAECCSHESGHSLGLSHQSKYDGTCNLTATYNEGVGVGVNAWAPIMGNSYYRNMTGWNNGPTPYGCANTQDNISIIINQNGFGLRPDDYSDDMNTNPGMLSFGNMVTEGVITTDTDKDAFKFILASNSTIHIDVKPFSVNAGSEGANLDIKMSLYNTDKVLIKTYDPESIMNVVVDTLLNSGAYYLVVDGAGNSNISDYGSLGSYSISALTGGVLPIQQISLTGRTDKNIHLLNWKVISDEQIKTIIMETSADGIHYAPLYTAGGVAKSFDYTPIQHTDLFYRVKAVTILNHYAYSNTVKLKSTAKTGKFKVSTFVHNQIIVNANEKYQYQLIDVNGQMMMKGNGIAGVNRIDVNTYPGGMYVLQLVNNNELQTERIIKQ